MEEILEKKQKIEEKEITKMNKFGCELGER